MSNPTVKILLTILVVTLCTSAYAFPLPTVNAAEPDPQTKTLTLLSDVVGLKTEQYTTTQNTQRDSQYLDQPQKEIDTYLASPQGSLRVSSSYIKDTLKLLYFSDIEGQPSLKQHAVNTVDSAKGLLERYQNSTHNSLYGNFASMLNDIDINANTTKVRGNIKLEASGDGSERASYMWTFIDENGVLAERKNVCLKYERGMLKSFSNNWPLYTIAETESKFSAKDATELAIDASKTYSYTVTDENGTEVTVSGFNIAPESLGYAKLIYVNSKEQAFARGGDPYRMYLAWYVPLGFDKFYPGDVTGLTVILWADTGEVCGMSRVIIDSGIPASTAEEDQDAVKEQSLQSTSSQSTLIPDQAIGVSATLGMVCVSLGTCKTVGSAGSKRRSRFWAILLCVSIVFSVMFFVIPQVSAIAPQQRSRIYGLGGPGGYGGYHNSTADDAEGTASRDICNYVGNVSEVAGFATANDFGSGTTVSNVGDNVGMDEVVFDKTIVFHVGHLTTGGYQDINGATISANYINSSHSPTSLGEHFFVFLWICGQAPTIGAVPAADSMAAAWTQNYDMDADGYGTTNSDGEGRCYISFYGFSPMLSNYPMNMGQSNFYEFSTFGDVGPCTKFIERFYNYTLLQDYSVGDSLDRASIDYFGVNFDDSVLYTSYNSFWPGSTYFLNNTDVDPNGDDDYLNATGYYPWDFKDRALGNNSIRVFGDSTIKLYHPQINFSALDSNNNSLDSSAVFTLDGENQLPGSARLVSKGYVVNVNDIANYDFSHFSYNGQNYGRSATIPLTSDGNLVAHYVYDPVYYSLTVSKTGSGTISPSGTSQHLSYTTVPVTATPDAGMMHYWNDGTGDLDWNQTTYVIMDGGKSMVAHFVSATAYNFVSHVEPSPTGVYNNPTKLIGPYSDGQCASIGSIEGYGYDYGEIVTHLYFTTAGHIYVNGSGSGPLYVAISTDGQNWIDKGQATVLQGSPGWLDCGYSLSPFSFIRFRAQGGIYSLYVDSVKVDSASYTLTVTSSGGGYTTPSGDSEYLIGTYAHVVANEVSGLVFSQWLLDGNPAGNNPSIDVYMNDDYALQAVFVPVTSDAYVSSITGSGGTIFDPQNLIGAEYNGQYALIVSFNEQYNLPYGWITGEMNGLTTGHIYVYGYALSGSGLLYVYSSTNGNDWSLVGTPSVSQQSPGWIDCGTCSGAFGFIKFSCEGSGDYQIRLDSVHVETPPPEYTLTVNVVGGGSVVKDPDQTTYVNGTQVELTAVSASGYQFAGWSGALTGTTNPVTVTMDGHKTVNATFTLIPPTEYTLTVNVIGGGSVTKNPNQITYVSGTSVQLTAVSASGYQFAGWSGALTGTTNPTTVTMDGHKTVNATFTPIVYYIDASAGSGGSISPSGSVQVGYGANQAFTITPNSGYNISQVTVDSQNQGAIGTYTFSNVQANHTISASFTPSGQELFSDGFESGDFSAWTGQSATYPTISSSMSHNSSYSAYSPSYTIGPDYYVYKDLGSTYPTLYYRVYVYFDSLPADGVCQTLAANYVALGSPIGIMEIGNSGGTYYWCLENFHYGVAHGTIHQFTYTPSSAIATGQWYCLEMKVAVGESGQGTMWVDGTQIINQTDDWGTASLRYVSFESTMRAGGGSSASGAYYGDCAEVANTYIGPETLATYNLTISSATGGTTNPSAGTYSIAAGTNQSVSATAGSGYTFDHWMLDSVNVGSTNPYSVEMNSNHTLQAVFTGSSQELFSDGFESGDFSAWTGQSATYPAISSSESHNSSYSAYSPSYTVGPDYYVYKDLGSTYSTLYYRVYVYFDSLPADGVCQTLAANYVALGSPIGIMEIGNSGGTYYWCLENFHYGVAHGTIHQFTYTPSSAIATGQWYCLEMKVAVGESGQGTMWVDGTQIINQTDDWGTASLRYVSFESTMRAGGGSSASGAYYGDCAEVASTYIGPET